MWNVPRVPRAMRELVNPTPIVSLGPVGIDIERSFGVVVSLHASVPTATDATATATTVTSTRCGFVRDIRASAAWDNEARRGDNDIKTPDVGLRSGSLLHPSRTESPVNPAHSACRADLEALSWVADA